MFKRDRKKVSVVSVSCTRQRLVGDKSGKSWKGLDIEVFEGYNKEFEY